MAIFGTIVQSRQFQIFTKWVLFNAFALKRFCDSVQHKPFVPSWANITGSPSGINANFIYKNAFILLALASVFIFRIRIKCFYIFCVQYQIAWRWLSQRKCEVKQCFVRPSYAYSANHLCKTTWRIHGKFMMSRIGPQMIFLTCTEISYMQAFLCVSIMHYLDQLAKSSEIRINK